MTLTLSLSLLLLFCIIRPRRSCSAAAYSRQTFPWTICRSVGPYVRMSVGRSVCPVQCGKTADPIGRKGPGIRQVVGFGDRSTGRCTFGGEFGARHCNQWELYGVCVRQRRDAALFLNYFGQTCFYLLKVTANELSRKRSCCPRELVFFSFAFFSFFFVLSCI